MIYGHSVNQDSFVSVMLSRYSVSFRGRTHVNSGGRHRQSCHRSMTAWRALHGSLCRWHKAALLSDAYWNRCTPVFPPELAPRSLWWWRAPALWCGPLSERVMFAWRAQAVWYQVAAARESSVVEELNGLQGSTGRLNNCRFAINYLPCTNSCLSEEGEAHGQSFFNALSPPKFRKMIDGD